MVKDLAVALVLYNNHYTSIIQLNLCLPAPPVKNCGILLEQSLNAGMRFLMTTRLVGCQSSSLQCYLDCLLLIIIIIMSTRRTYSHPAFGFNSFLFLTPGIFTTWGIKNNHNHGLYGSTSCCKSD